MFAPLGRSGLILLLLLVATPLQAAITLTTLNIKFYGSNPNETRDPAINRYLDENDLRSDVMVFQEIVDVERLKSNIIGFGYDCLTYDSPAARHQHVVVCHRPFLAFDQASDDDNFALENIAMGNDMYRPAVHGILRQVSSGKRLAHLVAVHLKAMPEDAEMRIEQVQMIHDYLAFDRHDSLPPIIVGDTNLFAEDVATVNEILTDGSLGLKALDTTEKYTYRVPERGQKFDRFWIGEGLVAQGAPRIVGPCNLTGTAGEAKIRTYNRDVSDHCAVAIKLSPVAR